MIVCRTTEETPRDNVNPFLYIFACQNKSQGKADFTVSIVGDDPCLLTGLARLVEGAGYPVQGFSSAADFLGQRETNNPGCVIIDLQSPDLDGLKLQATLAREELQLPVIFISEINDVPASVRVMKAGAFDMSALPQKADIQCENGTLSLVLVGFDVVVLHDLAPCLHLTRDEGAHCFWTAEGKRHLLRFNQLLGDTLLTPSRLPGDHRF